MYSGLARQSSKGSLHLAVAMRSGFCRQNSTVNPFCDEGGILKLVLSLVLWVSVNYHLGAVIESIVWM